MFRPLFFGVTFGLAVAFALAFALGFTTDTILFTAVFAAFIVLLMDAVRKFVAVSADGIVMAGIVGTGTWPPVKKEPIAKKR